MTSKIKQIRDYYNNTIECYYNQIKPYQIAIDNINKQIKVMKESYKLMTLQTDKKYNKWIKKEFKKGFKYYNEAYTTYNGYRLYSNNTTKIKKEYDKIHCYLSLKLILLNLQIDYITINYVSELGYFIYCLDNSFNVNKLKYKKYEFVYKLLINRGYTIHCDYYNFSGNIYHFRHIHYNNQNEPYKALKECYNIEIPDTFSVINSPTNVFYNEAIDINNIIPFGLRVYNVNDIYKLLSNMLYYINEYHKLKAKEYELNKDFRYDINIAKMRFESDVLPNLCDNNYANLLNIKDIAKGYINAINS